MPTGACGINCDVCKLNLLRACSSCGSGQSLEAGQKLAAQQRLFGSTCSILSCAQMNQIDYCMRDCLDLEFLYFRRRGWNPPYFMRVEEVFFKTAENPYL